MIRPTMIHGVEYWPIKKQDMYKMSVREMRMLRWMCGKTKKDKIRNECFLEHSTVASIGDKLTQTHLRWFGHVQHRPPTILLKKVFLYRLMPYLGKVMGQEDMDGSSKIYMNKCNLS